MDDRADRSAQDLAKAREHAAAIELQLAQLKSRRSIRIAEALGESRSWNVLRTGRRLAAAIRRQPLSREADAAPEAPQSARSGASVGPYPHLRIAHGGRLRIFDGLAPHVDAADLSDLGTDGFDLLLLEPGADDELADVPEPIVTTFRDAGLPVVLIARTSRHLDLIHAKLASLVVAEETRLVADMAGALVIAPSIDPRIHNPIGWELVASERLLDCTAETDWSGIELVAAAKRARVARTDDPRQALEIAAAGTPLVAAPDPRLDALLGDHYGRLKPSMTVAGFVELMADTHRREQISVAARRHVLSHHTRLRRLERLLESLSIPLNRPDRISVLLATKRPERLASAVSAVDRQEWPDKELVLLLHGDFEGVDAESLVAGLSFPVTLIQCPIEWTLGDCLNAGLDRATGDYVTKMDDDDVYGPAHLWDLHTALSYARAAAVGKLSNVTYLAGPDLTVDWRIGDQERKVHHLPGATMMMRREVIERYRFARVSRGVDTSLWERLAREGEALYSTHRLNFIRVRHGEHTYVRPDEDFLALATTVPEAGLNPERWFA
jgi:hypothetical protein